MAGLGLKAASQGQGRGVAHRQLDRKLTVRVHSSVRGKARRMVWGEAR
jgi:hypothetical protein